MQIGDQISESDFATILPDGSFVQLEYIEEESKPDPYLVKPGIFTIKKTMSGFKLEETSFVKDKVLSSFVQTKEVTDKIDCFFQKVNVYHELGFEVAKRAALLYGPAGTGKSTIISLVSEKYVADGKTAIIVWSTDQIEAYEVKSFIKAFSYVGVDKIILIAEDIGGVEIDQVRIKSDSSLLSLLDNQEKTFTIPVFILATTNFPEVFMGNLMNRPNRFDDKIEVGFPPKAARAELLKFFSKTEPSEEALAAIMDTKCNEFTPAHIREVVIRSMIYDKTIVEVIKAMVGEISLYNKAFSKQKSAGIGFGRYDD